MFFKNKKNKKKKQEDKQLKDPINFTRIISLFIMGFFVYATIAISIFLVYWDSISTFQDAVIIMLPLPIFIGVLIYLYDKDDKIALNNLEVQKELDRIKDMYDTRKGAEKQFDSS